MSLSYICPSAGYRLRPSRVTIDATQLKCHHCKSKFYAGNAEKVIDASAAPASAVPTKNNGHVAPAPPAFAALSTGIPAPAAVVTSDEPPLVEDDLPEHRSHKRS